MQGGKWSARMRRSFVEAIVPLIFVGLVLEVLFLFVLRPGRVGWLWMMPAIATFLGVMWLVAREPANL